MMIDILAHLLRFFPPEVAHYLTLNALKLQSLKTNKNTIEDPKLHQHIWGLDFINPIGLAAGFDKNAEVVMPLINIGFGFVEAGTVTPRPQNGNKKPRVFRLNQDKAIINNLGFNNIGMESVAKKLEKINLNLISNGVIGINIGKNKETSDAVSDYCNALDRLGPLAHYVAINVSSPNTPGLRNLQYRGQIEYLFKSLNNIKNKNENLSNKALLLKIAPDLNDEQLRDIALMSLALGVDGIIISNSTLDRPKTLLSERKNEIGGLSGRPLFINSTIILKKMYNLTNGQIPLIGVGGISSGIDCYEKIKSGASLVQLYTSLIYQGPSVIKKIKNELITCMNTDGYKNIKEVIGIDT